MISLGCARRWSWQWSKTLETAPCLFSMSGAYREPDRRNGKGRLLLQRRVREIARKLLHRVHDCVIQLVLASP